MPRRSTASPVISTASPVIIIDIIDNPQPLPSSPVIGGYVLLGSNKGDGMMCAGMGICEYSANPISSKLGGPGTPVTFQVVFSEFFRQNMLAMTFNLSDLQASQPWQTYTFNDIINGVSADGTPVPPVYHFDVPYALVQANFGLLGLPTDTVIFIPGGGAPTPGYNFEVVIAGDVVTIWLFLVDSTGSPW